MKVCHLSEMIALLNLAVMTISGVCLQPSLTERKLKNKMGRNSNITCHFQSDSSPSVAEPT